MKKIKINRIGFFIFIVLLLAYGVLGFSLFHHQALGNEFCYNSDMPAYILHIQGLESGYDFPYPVYFFVAKVIYYICGNPAFGMALATTLFNVFTAVVIKVSLSDYMASETDDVAANLLGSLLSTLLTFGVLFCSMLYFKWTIKFDINYRYLGVYSGTPWQNGTYLAARPFMLLAFLWYLKIMKYYEEGIKKEHLKDYIWYGVFLLLTTMTKPSYTILQLMVAACVMLVRLIKSKFRIFVPSLQLALFYLPTLAALLYQYRGVFIGEPGDGEHGIGFGFFSVWRNYVRLRSMPLAIVLAMAFPIVVFLLHLPELRRNFQLRSAAEIYVAGFVTTAFLYEKGFRFYHFNFAWGYMCGIFLCFYVSAAEMMRDTRVILRNNTAGDSRILYAKAPQPVQIIGLVLEWGLFLLHLVKGIMFFASLLSGGNFLF